MIDALPMADTVQYPGQNNTQAGCWLYVIMLMLQQSTITAAPLHHVPAFNEYRKICLLH